MAVNAIQKNKDNPPRMGYIKSIVAGSVAGYALKYVLPVASREKTDQSYKESLRQIRMETKRNKINSINEIRNSKTKTQSEDLFIKMYDNKEINAAKMKSLQDPQKTDIKNIISKINASSKELFKQRQKTINAVTKDIRPTAPFIITGITVALLTAFAYNVINQIAHEKIEKESAE